MASSSNTSTTYSHNSWTGKTGGALWMQRTLIRIFRVVPLFLVYAIMGLVIPFYMIFDKRGFRASYSFFRTRVRMPALCSLAHVYVNEFNLGMVVLDRFAMYAGKSFEIENECDPMFRSLCSLESGFMLVSSHVGNTELAGYSLDVKDKILNVLVFGKETATVMENREKMFGRKNVRMVPVAEDLSHIFDLNNSLREGGIVMIPGDRVFGSGKTLSQEFMGSPAKFPIGPFTLASQREVPVVCIFVVKTAYKRYRLYLKTLDCGELESLGRQEQVSALVAAYARELEAMVRQYPDQWYNFYDFWA